MSATKPVLLASDVHLGAVPPSQERAFLSWLDHAAHTASWIVLNGDLFDFWFEYWSGPTPGYATVLGALRRIVDAGVPVTLMGGNHDWWGGSYLRNEVGIEFLQEPVVRDIAGRRTLLAHGDGLGSGDLGYRLLRLLLRGRATRWAFACLPPAVGDRIARSVSRTSRKWDEWGEQQEARAAALADWAERRLLSDQELDMVVLGHTHRPVVSEISTGRWYVNTGDWLAHRSYVILDRGRDPCLADWNRLEP